MFIKYFFNITKHKKQLNEETGRVGVLKYEHGKISCPGSQDILLAADLSHSLLYYQKSQSFSARIKSFIPFTTAFNARVKCAKAIDKAYLCLNEIEKGINQNKNKEPMVISFIKPPPKELAPPAGKSRHKRADSAPPALTGNFSKLLQSEPVAKPRVKDDSFLPTIVSLKYNSEPLSLRCIAR